MTSKAISRWRDKRRQTAQGKINKKIGDNTIFEASIIIVGNLRVVTKELSQDYQNFKVIARPIAQWTAAQIALITKATYVIICIREE